MRSWDKAIEGFNWWVMVPTGVQKDHQFDLGWSEKTSQGRGHVIWLWKVARIQTGIEDSREFCSQGRFQKHSHSNDNAQGRTVPVMENCTALPSWAEWKQSKKATMRANSIISQWIQMGYGQFEESLCYFKICLDPLGGFTRLYRVNLSNVEPHCLLLEIVSGSDSTRTQVLHYQIWCSFQYTMVLHS